MSLEQGVITEDIVSAFRGTAISVGPEGHTAQAVATASIRHDRLRQLDVVTTPSSVSRPIRRVFLSRNIVPSGAADLLSTDKSAQRDSFDLAVRPDDS